MTRTGLRRSMIPLLVACSFLSASLEAGAGPPFLSDEISAAITNHDGHDHSLEIFEFGFATGMSFKTTNFFSTNFFHSELADSDFSDAIFDRADFSFADLRTSTFSRASFHDTILDDAHLNLSDFTDADFFGDGTLLAASFQRATVRGGSFDGADFTNSNLTNSQFRCIINPDQSSQSGFSSVCPTFIGTDFSGADLTSTLFAPAFAGDQLIFSNANFRGANFTDAVLAAISAPCLQTDSLNNTWACMLWGDDTSPNTITGLTLLNGSDLRGSNMRNLTFERGQFPGVLIGGTDFTGSTFSDVNLDNSIARCEAINLDTLGQNADVIKATADHAKEVDLCAFLSTNNIKKTLFRDASFSNVSFADADLSNTDFTDTTATPANFKNVILDRVSLGCPANPSSFGADCGDCAIFTGRFANQPAPAADGRYSIQMRNIEFDNILACSVLSFDDTGDHLIDDLSNVDLNGASFSDADVAAAAVDFSGSSLVAVNFGAATLTGLNFDGADMTNANLATAVAPCDTVRCASFAGTTLEGAVLSQVAWTAPVADPPLAIFVNFDDANLDAVTAINSDFTGARFGDQDGDGNGATFVGATLDSSRFDDASFTNADFTSAIAGCLPDNATTACASFNGASFTNSNLRNANFIGADLRGTAFSGGSDLSGANFSGAQFDATTSLGDSQIDGLVLGSLTNSSKELFQNTAAFAGTVPAVGVNLNSVDLSGFNFKDLTLTNWSFDRAVLSGANFACADLNGAKLTNLQLDEVFGMGLLDTATCASPGTGNDTNFLAGADLTGSDLQGIDLSGFDLSNTDLTSVGICDPSGNGCAKITNATLRCANLSAADFPSFAVDDGAGALVADATMKFQFVASDLSGINLAGNDLTNYDFSTLDLSGADLQGSVLSGADFRGATLNGARLENAQICDTSGTNCAVFGSTSVGTSKTDLVGSPDCDLQQAVDFSGVSFVSAPLDLLEGKIMGDSVVCVNFTGADLSYIDAAKTSGFDFNDLTVWTGAVLAGAQLRHQDFSVLSGRDPALFQQLGHAAASRDDICTSADDVIAPIDTSTDLRATIFSCATLTHANFSTALNDADLRGAEFVRTTIGASFALTGAKLEGADFSNVDFGSGPSGLFQDIAKVANSAGIKHPDLRNVTLAHADLSAGTFNLSGVDLGGATLDGANLSSADLTNAILDGLASLCGAYDTAGTAEQFCPVLHRPDNTCVNLGTASVAGASFRDIDFTELFESNVVNFEAREFFQQVPGGDLKRTDFTGANLAGLNLDGIDFTDAISIGLSFPCSGTHGCASFSGARFGSSDPKLPASFASYNFQQASIAGATFENVSLSSAVLSGVGDVCPDPATNCLKIIGKNSSLQGANLRDLDLTNVGFGTSTADKVINFRNASFVGANLAGRSDLDGRDFGGADFTAANLTGTKFDEAAILANISSGCETINGNTVCTNFDGASLCGTDAHGAHFEGSFANVDALPSGCSRSANFRGASFTQLSLSTANFENANLDFVSFDSSVSFCSTTSQCVVLNGASLVGATLSNIDFDAVPDNFFTSVLDDNFQQVDFSGSDLSEKNLTGADLSFADLSGTDLRNADFSTNPALLRDTLFFRTEFARGATSNGTTCLLAPGASPTDLRGADLSGADLSRARHFQRGCILVDLTTRYSSTTRFPAGFELLTEISVPEPDRQLLELTALAVLAWLVHRRRYTEAL